MIEIHGLRCTKGAALNEPGGASVTVMDNPPHVRLSQAQCSFPALLTPDEAEWFAGQLVAAAARVRALSATAAAPPEGSIEIRG
jgi:hypothetical protein